MVSQVVRIPETEGENLTVIEHTRKQQQQQQCQQIQGGI